MTEEQKDLAFAIESLVRAAVGHVLAVRGDHVADAIETDEAITAASQTLAITLLDD